MTDATALLRRVLEPSRIALIGASSDPLSLSGRYLHHLQRHHYGGEILPVNPRRDEIGGLPCAPSVGAIEGPVDTALVIVDGAKVEGVVAECVEAEVPGVVVFSSGFGEAGPEGVERQRRMLKRLGAADGRTRLLGPNSPGFVNYHARTAVAASAYLQQAELIPGDVALLSQSGAIGGIVASRALDRGIGLSHLVFAGNEADVTVSDLLETMTADERVGCIVVVAETLRDLRRFREAAERAAEAGKTVVVLRVGVSVEGQRAAMAHTGALANDAAAVEAVLDRVGAISVTDIDELVDLLDARRVVPAGGVRRLGVLCTSGGLASMAADVVGATPVELPPLSERAAGELAELIPDFGSTLNPTDLTGMIVQQPELIEQCLLALEDDDFDAIVAVLTVHPEPLSITLAEHLVSARAAVGTPVLVAWESGSISFAGIDALRRAGIPTFNSLAGCLGAIGRLATESAVAIEGRSAADVGSIAAARRDGAAAFASPAVGSTGAAEAPLPRSTTIPELRALELLAVHGLTGPAGGLATTREEAVSLAAAIGYPVVAKLQSADVPHRAKLGGVLLGLESEVAVADGFDSITAVAASLDVSLDGVSIVSAVPDGHDVFIGVRRTEAGWLLVLAPGGVDVESERRVWRSLLPLRPAEVNGAVARLFPGAPASARALASEALGSVEAALTTLPPTAVVLELNPLRVLDSSTVVLDALIELELDGGAEAA